MNEWKALMHKLAKNPANYGLVLNEIAEKLDEASAGVEAIKADNERLRGLIRQAEYSGGYNECPWCGGADETTGHGPSPCLAFTPDGEAR